MPRYLIIDTSILCVYLRVPGFETCGPIENQWTHERVAEQIEAAKKADTTLILPIATLIETGNHIS